MAASRDPDGRTERQAVRDRTIAHFSRQAATYQQRYAAPPAGEPRSGFMYARGLLDDMLDRVLAGVPAAGRVLDVGCGTGRFLRRLRDRGYEAVGVEPSDQMRAEARRLVPDAPVLAGVITDLPFADRQFDLVMATGVLRYLPAPDVRVGLREMLRVTRPGGRVLCTAVNRLALNPFYPYYLLRRALRFAGIAPPIHCEFTTARAIRRDLIDLGAAEVTVLPWVVIPFVRPMYRLHPSAGGFAARAFRPLERALSALGWTAHIAGGLIAVARRGVEGGA